MHLPVALISQTSDGIYILSLLCIMIRGTPGRGENRERDGERAKVSKKAGVARAHERAERERQRQAAKE